MGIKKIGTKKEIAKILDFIWILDVSGSMHGERIKSLNRAIKEAIPVMQEASKKNPDTQIMIRALTFSSEVNWHVSKRTPINHFKWIDVEAKGLSSLGSALTEIASVLDDNIGGLPPVLVLITDGEPTDDYKKGLETLKSKAWNEHAIRLGISVSDEVDQSILEEFIDHPRIKPIEVENSFQLTYYIQYICSQVLLDVIDKQNSHSLFKLDIKVPEFKVPKGEIYDLF